ncbi:MAG: bifunctional phosphoribosyl-AMP cyclohydrolase/phosphoribosyl-ATP diphosphatase HisIE [Patescibacteria group bacterium]
MQLDFQKLNGLIPAIIQDSITNQVLMLGFMDKAAYAKTIKTKKVCFYSRTKKKLWTKGETSGNFLNVIKIKTDCDSDCLLIKVKPQGLTCHKGKYSCFGEKPAESCQFLFFLFDLIKERKKTLPAKSYTASLFNQGLEKILEKIDEEAGEVQKAAKEESKKRLIEEGADLLYHLFVLMAEKRITLQEIVKELQKRNQIYFR